MIASARCMAMDHVGYEAVEAHYVAKLAVLGTS